MSTALFLQGTPDCALQQRGDPYKKFYGLRNNGSATYTSKFCEELWKSLSPHFRPIPALLELHSPRPPCVGHWKSYYKRFHFDPLKCMAGLMYNVKRIGVWKYEAKMSRDWPPPPHSEPPSPHLPEAPIEGSVYHQPGTEVDIPVTARRAQVSTVGAMGLARRRGKCAFFNQYNLGTRPSIELRFF